MSDTYAIAGWGDHYEKSQSRRAKKHHWVAMPIQHDGAGFRRITIQDDATDLFAAWCLIVQVGAKCKTRGVLANEYGVALDSEDLAVKTGFPISIFERAFDFFSDTKIGWLKRVDSERTPSETEKTPSESRFSASEKPHNTVQYNTDNTTPANREVVESVNHPEYRHISSCEELNKISIESYLHIKQSFPKVRHEEVVKMAVLKAKDPDKEIKSQFQWLVSQFRYADEIPESLDCSHLIAEICE